MNFNFLNPKTFNIPTPDFELRDPDLVTKEILNFLKQTTIEQSNTSRIQFRTNLLLTITTIVIGIIALTPLFVNQNKTQNNIHNDQLSRLIELQEQNTKLISELSSNLHDLSRQVQILEIQSQETSKN